MFLSWFRQEEHSKRRWGDDVSAARWEHSDCEISADVIDLGGDGGDRGGGGGGGVLGPVGPQAVKVDTIVVDGKHGKSPGGGGGGGGVVLPGALGYDSAERNGTEGSGFSAGLDGQDGGDTYIQLPDGTIIARALGGKGGHAGRGARSTSDGLSVSALLADNYAEIMPGGLATLVGAGWQSCRVLNIGDTKQLPVFMIIEAGGVPAGDYTIHVDAFSSSGIKAARVSFPVTVNSSGDLLRIARGVDLHVVVDAFGIWRIVVSSELNVLAGIGLMVKRFGEPELDV